jgi:putative hydrolase of the HAD superfamily
MSTGRAASSGAVRAVFFDVDFTLIYPGPTFQGEGYERFCASYGMAVDRARFADSVRAASSLLEDGQQAYDEEIFVRYTARIIEGMGGAGPQVQPCAREIYAEWAACHHFFLYDDVAPALRALAARGFKVGLISNSHRSLDSFQQHFELDGLIAGAVSSSEHGYLKPHPSIFRAAMTLLDVAPGQSVMVGDSLPHDIAGARQAGMRAVLVHRSDDPLPETDVPIIRTLVELADLI